MVYSATECEIYTFQETHASIDEMLSAAGRVPALRLRRRVDRLRTGQQAFTNCYADQNADLGGSNVHRN